MVTMAVPLSFSRLCTTAPKRAVSPAARKRGNAGFSSTGLLVRISRSSHPKRDARSPATAMIRYVVRLSGSVTSAAARPEASVVTDPSQNARTRKSFRTSDAGPPSAPPPPPSSAPFPAVTRRLTMF